MNRLLLLFLVVGSVLAAHAGFGFTINEGLINNAPTNPTDDLLDAARWTNHPDSCAEQGVRGLGGALNTPSPLNSAPGLFHLSSFRRHGVGRELR